VLSQSEERAIDIVLVRAPEGVEGSAVTIDGASPFAGATVETLSPRLAQRLRLPDQARGVAIVDIDRSSPAASLGLRPGDIVHEVNGVEIDTPAALEQAASEQTRWWRFTLEREGRLLRQALRF